MAALRAHFVPVILWITVVASASNIRIRPSGDKFTKPLGSSIVLTCELQQESDSDKISVRWLDNNKAEITDSPGRVYVEKDGTTVRKLYITAIQNQDAGNYSCIADVNGKRTDKSVLLMLFKDITFDHAPSPQHPQIYTDCLMECVVSGEPRPEVSWRYKGRRIPAKGRYTVESRGLRIHNVTEADNGDYTCRAEVEVDGRYDERRLSLVVHIPPVMDEGVGHVEGIDGQSVELACKASGFPDPKYEFRKVGGSKILTSAGVEANSETGRLTFKTVRKSDEGRYSCHAINDVGTAVKYTELRVLVPAKIYEFESVNQPEETRATLVCLASGDPSPNITLYRVNSYGDRVPVETNVVSDSGRIQLMINKLTPDDTSSYVCQAANVAGSNESTASVTVSYKPRFTMYHNTLIYSWAGKTTNISCNVRAHPAPTVEWIHNNMILSDNTTYHLHQLNTYHYLQVRVTESDRGWIYGDYVCRATNTFGSSSYTFQLLRATVPDEPQDIVIKQRTPNIVVIEVVPPIDSSGLEVLGYRVEYEGVAYDFDHADRLASSTEGGNNGTVEATFPDHEIRLENLRPSTTYVLRVGVKNEVGVGKMIEKRITTENVRVPYPVQITSPHQADKPSEYTLTWHKPWTGGQPITAYDIRYRQVNVKAGTLELQQPLSDWMSRQRADSSLNPSMEFTLTGLSGNTHYQVEVYAANKLGKSPASESFIFLTGDGPEGPGIAPVQASVGMTTVLAVVIALLVALLVVIDISCYFMQGCGLTMCICVHICGHDSTANGAGLKATDKEMEEGESKEMLKPPSTSSPTLEHGGKMAQEQLVSESEEALIAEQQLTEVTKEPPVEEPPQEEELRPKNRRSVLSQGDERWKDVVQELENQLGKKKVFREDDENDSPRSKPPEHYDEQMPLTSGDQRNDSPAYSSKNNSSALA